MKFSLSAFTLVEAGQLGFKGFLTAFFMLILIFLPVFLIGYSWLKLKDREPNKQESIGLIVAGGFVILVAIIALISIKNMFGSSGGSSIIGLFLREVFRNLGEVIKSGAGEWVTLVAGLVILGAGILGILDLQKGFVPAKASSWQAPQQPQQPWQAPQQQQWQAPQQSQQPWQPPQQEQWQAPQEPLAPPPETWQVPPTDDNQGLG